MKITLFSIIFFLSVNSIFSQGDINWSWRYDFELKSLVFRADIAEGWHLYSQYVASDIGPVPTAFSFKKSENVNFIGSVLEPVPIQKYDENFEATLDFFEHNVDFIQKVEAKENSKVEGVITYMVCSETRCLPPVDLPFIIEISK